MITAKMCMDEKDVLGDLVKGEGQQADAQTVRGIYVRNTHQSLADKMTLERHELQADEKLIFDMKVLSGEIRLDAFGKEIKAPVASKLLYANEGRDPLGELVYGRK